MGNAVLYWRSGEHARRGGAAVELDAGALKVPRLRWTRRQFLRGAIGGVVGVGALAGAGYVGYRWPRPSPAATPAPTGQVYTWVSQPDLQPPMVSVTRGPGQRATVGSRLVFIAPKGYSAGGPGQAGRMIVDGAGHPIWFQRTPSFTMNLNVQAYRGNPVLTWWEGNIVNGYGEGACTIADSSYTNIATVQAGNGLKADLHEFVITAQDTALITAYRTVKADLSAVGGSGQGQTLEGIVQEIDIATGAVLFEWHSLQHVGIEESHAELSGSGTSDNPFDYFHINSIAVAPDGNLIVSARNTWALYKIDKSNGNVIWRLGGKRSDFTLDDGATFYWQHDARPHGLDQISLFDDGASPAEEKQSRGLVLGVDAAAHHVTVARSFTHPSELLAPNQGNLQLLPEGGAFVGWGAQPYFSAFDQSGDLVFDGRLPADDQSYRAFLQSWTGRPTALPALAVASNAVGGYTVYVSWNGATEVTRWQVLAGSDASSLSSVATAGRTGFETAISVGSSGPFFAVVALDNSGHELARSAPIEAHSSGGGG